MNVKCLKSSVVIEPYESKRLPNKDDSKTNLSTIVRSEGSGRKWKVSESITPVMSEFDRFSLRIASETSFTNRSCGSLNESFEKNLHFNLQNSLATSYSSDSRSKKVSISAAPLVKSIKPIVNEINVIRDTQTLMEVENENDEGDYDVDDVCLSSESENLNDYKPPINDCCTTNKIQVKECEIPEFECSEDVILETQPIDNATMNNGTETVIQKPEPFNDFVLPVDIDASQSLLINKTLQIPSPISEKSCVVSEVSSYQQSKLCDISKAYILSQDSSLISSPMDRGILKSVISLPGRSGCVPRNSEIIMKPSPMKTRNIFNVEGNENKEKQPFYKSTFIERRLRELEKFEKPVDFPIDNSKKESKKGKNKPKTKTKPKPKENKENKSKPISKRPPRKKKNIEKSNEDNIFTVDSTKDQVKDIIIEDSDIDKFDHPIEKARGNPNASDDDLFCNTPELVTKRKRKIPKKSLLQSKRVSKASTIYDIMSDMSSPSPVRLSYTAMKSSDNGFKESLGSDVISKRFSLRNVVAGFESDLKQMKILHQSMTYQLNQFKEMAKSLYPQ